MTALLKVERLLDNEGDLTACNAIERACFFSNTVGLREELGRSYARIWVARAAERNEPKGFLLAWHVADELQILSMATDPACRRIGIAKALLTHAIAYAAQEGMQRLVLEVRQSNRAAIALYRTVGFFVTNIRPRYYHDTDEAAMEMALLFDPVRGRDDPHSECAT